MSNTQGYAECPKCGKYLVYTPGCIQCGWGIPVLSLEEQAQKSAEFWAKESKNFVFPELAVVELTREIEGDALNTCPAGLQGTVMLVHDKGVAYCVEFPDGVVIDVPAGVLKPAPTFKRDSTPEES